MPSKAFKNIASWVFKYKGTQAEAQALLDAHLVTKKNYFHKQVGRQTHMWAQLYPDQSHFNSAQREFRAPQPPEGGDPFHYYYFSLTPKHKQPSTTIHTLWRGLALQDGEEVVAAEGYCVNLDDQNQPEEGGNNGNDNIEIEIAQDEEGGMQVNEEGPLDDAQVKGDTLSKRLKVSQLTTLVSEAVRPLIEEMKTHVNTKVAEMMDKMTFIETNFNLRLNNIEETIKKAKEDRDMAPPVLNLNRRNRS